MARLARNGFCISIYDSFPVAGEVDPISRSDPSDTADGSSASSRTTALEPSRRPRDRFVRVGWYEIRMRRERTPRNPASRETIGTDRHGLESRHDIERSVVRTTSRRSELATIRVSVAATRRSDRESSRRTGGPRRVDADRRRYDTTEIPSFGRIRRSYGAGSPSEVIRESSARAGSSSIVYTHVRGGDRNANRPATER